jgi:Tol biopolymer transport system component
VWSPDKTLIAFESEYDGRGQIVVMNADGSNAHAVTKSTINSRSPVWLDK